MFSAFYSDPHFGHKAVIGYCSRPFDSLGDMHEQMVSRYNAVVGPDDWCLWLGDCLLYMGEHEARAMLARLNGYKGLVIGNHDRSKAWMTRIGFAFAVDQLQMDIAGRKVIACHYPYAGSRRRDGRGDTRFGHLRPRRLKGQVLLHGHTHSRKRIDGSMVHVGVDAWDYTPATHAQVSELVASV